MRTDRQTDTTKPIVAFRNFKNGPKNRYINTTNKSIDLEEPDRSKATLSVL